jgi:FlaA1/EpsC-like NDP-sugar epimerase
MKQHLLKVRGFLIALAHLAIITTSLAIAFWIRFDFAMVVSQMPILVGSLLLVAPVKMATFLVGGVHRGWWRFAGLTDLVRIFVVNVAASAVAAVVVYQQFGRDFPRSVYVIDFLLCFLMTAGVRFCVRLYNETLRLDLAAMQKGMLIYGAGAAGRTLLREVRTHPELGFQVLGFIDDDPSLRFAKIMNVTVLGGGRELANIVDRYKNKVIKVDEVVITMPSASGRQMREAHSNCRAAGVPCKTIPGIGDLLSGKFLSAQIRGISLEDLLGRKQIVLEQERIQASLAGKTVLITGAAGSIGSELCRQTAGFVPSKLIIFDQAESDLFKIDQELRRSYPDLNIIVKVGDVRDIRTVDEVVQGHAVDAIFHAAAYKHVPMMEAHVVEAVRNNIVGTWNLVKIAQKHRVPNFLMISSDKAVNPTSIMGVTKRIAELIVSASNGTGTKFVSVRFGNVLGSNGSVVPTFQSQIAAGGPLTVTHPDMRRYFMSIREAVQLVLQASTMGKGTEIFVLDMGEPVRILDLARNMIELAGLVPGEDIEIRFTGLRPGEKLQEEVALDDENMLPTYHEKIRIFASHGVDVEALSNWLTHLQLLIGRRDSARIVDHLKILVPEYASPKAPAAAATQPEPATGTEQVKIHAIR